MGRFARTIEECFIRRKELKDTDRKAPQGYFETFLLYQLILIHSWATGKCDKTLSQICNLYQLEYHNSTRRLKILREKGWVENTDQYIRPLLVYRAEKKKDVKITPDKPADGVNSTPKSGVEFTPQSVIFTPNQCKNYTKNGKNGVNSTPENGETPYQESDSGDARLFKDLKPDFKDSTAAENLDDFQAAAAVEINNRKSQFSLADCLRYAEICVKRGDPIKSVDALANHAFNTGKMDAFIQNALYPEPTPLIADAPEQTIEYSDDYYAMPEAEPLNDDERRSSLQLLRGMLRETTLDKLETFAVNFTRDDWSWLMKELQK